ncbi:nucleoside recognition domain-containing protein [Bacillus salitolerans]|uniref:Nucleoside recognition domain-containing protein n=1 Tax=Bacillus salitolerans TaxID=1437434 RepID=A0ABW4LXU1_9BACI
MLGSVRRGFFVGLNTTWTLGKVIFPITIIVTLLQYTPVMKWAMNGITPLMGWIGLSGDAAIPLVLGNLLNLYAAIGAILSLDLTVKEVFILAVMLSFSHNMIVESTVAKRVGVSIGLTILVRVGLAIISAVVINLVWSGGGSLAQYGLITKKEEVITGWGNILIDAFSKAGLGIFQLAMIVIPLMIVIQLLKDLQWLSMFSKWMSPFTRLLGMKENTSTTLAAGLLFGLAFGAGVMIQAAKEDGVSKKDLTLAFIFLVSCHAVVEDTLIFIPLGIPVLPLLIIRIVTAVLLTIIVAYVWKRVEVNRKEASYEN